MHQGLWGELSSNTLSSPPTKPNKAVIKHNKWHIKKAKTNYQAQDKLEVQRDLPAIDQSETGLCIALWRSVLMQILVDLASNSNKPDYLKIKAEAMQWFYEGFKLCFECNYSSDLTKESPNPLCYRCGIREHKSYKCTKSTLKS